MPQVYLVIVDVHLFEICPTVISTHSTSVFPSIALYQAGLPAESHSLRRCQAVYFFVSVASVKCLHVCGCVHLCLSVCVPVSVICLKECV